MACKKQGWLSEVREQAPWSSGVLACNPPRWYLFGMCHTAVPGVPTPTLEALSSDTPPQIQRLAHRVANRHSAHVAADLDNHAADLRARNKWQLWPVLIQALQAPEHHLT